MKNILLSCRVNGEDCQLVVKPSQTLLEALRDGLHLTGAKEGCGNGNCGSCTVIMDGRAVNSCLVLAREAEGRDILTIEGLAAAARGPDTAGKSALHPVQQAFLDHHAVQCGFCTPGTVLAAAAWLQGSKAPSEAEVRAAIAGNLCRCTGYDRMVKAIAAASHGPQPFEPPKGRQYVGLSAPRVDGHDKVTGEARYGADTFLPGLLYARVLRCPYPHARIKSIDASRAAVQPGVKAVITGKDLPPLGKAAQTFGMEGWISAASLRKLVMAGDKAFFEGQAVAAIAATGLEIADEAVKLIKVDYEQLPFVLDAQAAMQPGAPLLYPDLLPATLAEKGARPGNIASYSELGWGDVDKAFREADVVVERTLDTQVVNHGYLEPLACTASVGAEGHVTVWTSTQGTFNCQRQLTALLGLPQAQLTIVPTEVGGGFGGRTTAILEPLAILLSQKAGRPVKLVMRRDEVFRAGGAGAPAHMTVKVGARKDGKLVAAYARLIYDIGAFPSSPTASGAMIAFGPYKLENMKVESSNIVTNKLPVLMYRAPGGTPSVFAVETVMDMMAEKLGMDPLAFRQVNAVSQGDPMSTGQTFGPIGLRQLLDTVAGHSAWTDSLEGPHRGRGLAAGYWLGAQASTSSAWVYVQRDGTVNITTGHVDLTGTRTALRQMAAQLLQIPLERVSIHTNDTSSSPFSDQTVGSRTAVTYSVALDHACRHAVAQMKVHAANRLNVAAEAIDYSEGQFCVSGQGGKAMSWDDVAFLTVKRLGGPVLGVGSTSISNAPGFAVHIADVEVEPETGKTKLLRYTCFQDVGGEINPALVEGQIQGAVSQGIGWALTEGYDYADGKLQNASFLDYRIPTATDVPPIETVRICVPSGVGPYGLRGVGEIPIVPVPAAIANAIYRACGVRMDRLPMTPEAVWRAMKGKHVEDV
ncbi:MAG: molybdopterin-dependent oxidoreductase [Chloroflexi bacterium]|nr:molybdopterin-dependent oxidoreductase [Chloroflexota bacterium]